MEFRFIVVDEFGESVRAFYDKESADRFVSIRKECKVQEIPNVEYDKEDFNFDEFTKIHGEPPF